MNKKHTPQGRGRHRQTRAHPWHHLQEVLWPSMGMKRFLRWLFYKIIRHGQSPHALALGFAFGVFASFTPFVGLHLGITFLLCWVARASYVAGVLGTLIGNPWTATPIWFSIYKLGHFILQHEKPRALPETMSLAHIWQNIDFYAYNYFIPMLVGGLILGTLFAVAFYYPLRFHIDRWHRHRQQRVHAKTAARLEKKS